jgi:hypothetical protein
MILAWRLHAAVAATTSDHQQQEEFLPIEQVWMCSGESCMSQKQTV